MKYWIIIDSVQQGPLSIEELSSIPGLNMSTPVWHEGLPDWTTASAVAEISAMLAANTNRQQEFRQPYDQNTYSQQWPYDQTNQSQQSYGQQYQGQQSYGQANHSRQSYGTYNPGQFNAAPYGQSGMHYGQAGGPYDPNRMPPMPNNYLVWAIIATICCCLPSGVIAIIYAAKVSPAYMRGDYNAALDASEKAQWWVIISFVAGLIWAPFSIIFGML